MVARIVKFCVCSMTLFSFALVCVLSSFAVILMGKRDLVALQYLSSWSLVTVVVMWIFLMVASLVTVIVTWTFLTVPWMGLPCVILVFSGHTHLPFWIQIRSDILPGRPICLQLTFDIDPSLYFI